MVEVRGGESHGGVEGLISYYPEPPSAGTKLSQALTYAGRRFLLLQTVVHFQWKHHVIRLNGPLFTSATPYPLLPCSPPSDTPLWLDGCCQAVSQ